VIGLVFALGAFLTGPSQAAVGVRTTLARAVGGLRHGAVTRRLQEGPVGPWVHEHRGVLRIAVVVLAALVVVLLDRPTGAAILGVAFVLIVLLGVIEFLDQPREHTPPPDGPLASRGGPVTNAAG
jgi:hypothetical protein